MSGLWAHCPFCACTGRRLFEAHGYWIRECGSCSHRWAEIGAPDRHVERVYDDSYFFAGGAGYPDYTRDRDALIQQGKAYGHMLAKYAPPGHLLDVGAAAGFILRGMIDSGWSGVGIEPNETMAAYARDELGMDVSTLPLEDYEGSSEFDVISMIQVLPHFVDPKSAMVRGSELLRPGGFLLIETWNCASVSARLWGRRWHEYSPPSVLHWFTPSGLRQLAEGLGYSQVARGRPKKRISGAHAKSLVRHKLEGTSLFPFATPLFALFPDRLTMPYPSDDVFWILFRHTGRA